MNISIKAALLAVTALVPSLVLAQTAAPAPADDGGYADIIVTARKTEEKLQNAPTTVAVATAEMIDRLGLDSVADITKTTAGIVFDDSFGRDGNRPVIRGQANILGSSGVAYFIDGIYYSGSIADYDVESVSRIEVVKGPQSALYGRNTYSGAINIISKMPGDRWEGKVSADISERDRCSVSFSTTMTARCARRSAPTGTRPRMASQQSLPRAQTRTIACPTMVRCIAASGVIIAA